MPRIPWTRRLSREEQVARDELARAKAKLKTVTRRARRAEDRRTKASRQRARLHWLTCHVRPPTACHHCRAYMARTPSLRRQLREAGYDPQDLLA